MPFELDHVFCFVEPDAPEAARLEAAGFVVAPTYPHPGQGTANRSVLFAESYLELIYLTSREDAEASEIGLHRRADWRTTGECPFGVGLRGTLSDTERAAFWPYLPPYATKGRPPIWVHRATTEAPGLPLVFVMEPYGPFKAAADLRPERWIAGERRSLLEQPAGARGLDAVQIEVPDGRGWPVGLPVPRVTLEPGLPYRMLASLEAGPLPAVNIAPHLELRSRS